MSDFVVLVIVEETMILSLTHSLTTLTILLVCSNPSLKILFTLNLTTFRLSVLSMLTFVHGCAQSASKNAALLFNSNSSFTSISSVFVILHVLKFEIGSL